MALYRIDDKAPQVAASAYIAAEATLIGAVSVGERATVLAGAVARADNEPIVIGNESNVQEGAVLHADPGFPLTIGKRVTVGHQAMLHGCTIGDGALIGIQAVVMNGAVADRRRHRQPRARGLRLRRARRPLPDSPRARRLRAPTSERRRLHGRPV